MPFNKKRVIIRQPFIASILITVAMLMVAFFFEVVRDYISLDWRWWLFIILMMLLVQIVNYLILSRLFKIYSRNQINKLSRLFPQQMLTENPSMKDLYEIGEKFSKVTKRHQSEIVTMKEMEAYRKEYVGNVAHELKTPLFAIQGYAETLLDGAAENEEIRERYLHRITMSVERLLSVVSDLDMINKFESGEIVLNLKTFDLVALVREVFEVLDGEASKTSAQLSLDTAENQIQVFADRQRIFQVFLNLIANAIHYAQRDNAKITVRMHVLKDVVLITVEDNGMGIKKENLNRIFERFYRVESSRTRREGGSGLGLAIVKHILDAHGHNISVESEYLEGTTFSFMLDIAPRQKLS